MYLWNNRKFHEREICKQTSAEDALLRNCHLSLLITILWDFMLHAYFVRILRDITHELSNIPGFYKFRIGYWKYQVSSLYTFLISGI